jgi:glycosyltransferase involved in cell wall biosynthesis
MVNVEAAWMGVPVVCYGDKQVPETVINGITGIKVPYRNVKKLTLAIEKLLMQSDMRKIMGNEGISLAKRDYLFESQVNRLRKFYKLLKVI